MAEMRGSNDYVWKEGQPEIVGEEDKNISKLTVKLEVDCSDALKGLKAITRETKKATAALKELEEQKSKVIVTNNITVSNESDIQKIAKELHKSIQRDSRSRGI